MIWAETYRDNQILLAPYQICLTKLFHFHQKSTIFKKIKTLTALEPEVIIALEELLQMAYSGDYTKICD